MKYLPLLITLIATPAFAHTQSGVGNSINTINSNNPRITARGGNASQRQDQDQRQEQGQSQSGVNSNDISYEARRNPVSSAIAAPLVAADDTCMGSTSAGGQAIGFGLSVGSTWRDADCVRRKDARELFNMGQQSAALALLCQSEEVASAMQAVGTECPGATARKAPETATGNVQYEYPRPLR